MGKNVERLVRKPGLPPTDPGSTISIVYGSPLPCVDFARIHNGTRSEAEWLSYRCRRSIAGVMADIWAS